MLHASERPGKSYRNYATTGLSEMQILFINIVIVHTGISTHKPIHVKNSHTQTHKHTHY